MKIKCICCGLISLLLITKTVAGQKTEAELMSYLRKNITVYYASQPKKGDLEFTRIKPEAAENMDNIIFGKTSNNGMEICSQFIISLFRTKNASREFLSHVYHAMQIGQKPIDIFILNDLNGLDQELLDSYLLFSVQDPKKKAYIWPGSYSVDDAPDRHRAIIFGEALLVDLQHLKDRFCEMVVSAQLNEYGPAKKFLLKDVPMNGPEGSDFNRIVSYPDNDTRQAPTHGVANAFTFSLHISLRTMALQWTHRQTIFVPTFPTSKTLPKEKTFRGVIMAEKPQNAGTAITNPPYDLPRDFTANYRIYSEEHFIDMKQPKKYLFLNDIYLGLIYSEMIRKVGIAKFVEAIRYGNHRFMKANPEEKTAILFENMSLVMLNGKNFEDLARSPGLSKQGESFAIALYDLFGPFNIGDKQSSLASDFANSFEQITGGRITGGISEQIIPYYLATWQSKVQSIINNYKFVPGKEFNEDLVDKIASLMGL